MALVDERGCRRDIRSNGWIDFRGSSLFQNRSGRRNEFSSFGADFLRSAISPGPRPSVKSGPDVFADALVPPERHRSPGRASPQARASSAWLYPFRIHLPTVRSIRRPACASRSRLSSSCSAMPAINYAVERPTIIGTVDDWIVRIRR